MKKQVVVIGLGRFGTRVAKELYQLGHDVLAIDLDEKNVQAMLGHVTYAVKSDATSETVLEELGVPNFDVGIIGIGSNFQSSILITLLLKSFSLPFIISRAANEPHGHTLEKIGADKVVFPEDETGKNVAHMLFEQDIIDYMEISPDFNINKIRPSDQSIHKTLEEAGLNGARDKYGLSVLMIRRGREHILIPSKDEEIKTGDVLIIAGKSNHLEKFLNRHKKEMPLDSGHPKESNDATKDAA